MSYSNPLVERVMRLAGLTPNEKLVLSRMVRWAEAGDGSGLYAGSDLLADETGLHPETILEIKSALRAKGVLRLKDPSRNSSKSNPDSIAWENCEERPPYKHPKHGGPRPAVGAEPGRSKFQSQGEQVPVSGWNLEGASSSLKGSKFQSQGEQVPVSRGASSSLATPEPRSYVKDVNKDVKDDSNHLSQRINFLTDAPLPHPETPPPFSPYISEVTTDFSQELGDEEHTVSNVTQALRLWGKTDLDEEEFVSLMYEAKGRTRSYQGKHGTRGIENKMPYFFKVLRDLVEHPPAPPPEDPPASSAPLALVEDIADIADVAPPSGGDPARPEFLEFVKRLYDIYPGEGNLEALARAVRKVPAEARPLLEVAFTHYRAYFAANPRRMVWAPSVFVKDGHWKKFIDAAVPVPIETPDSSRFEMPDVRTVVLAGRCDTS